MSCIGNTPYYFNCPLCKKNIDVNCTIPFVCTYEHKLVKTTCANCHTKPRVSHLIKCCSQTICLPCLVKSDNDNEPSLMDYVSILQISQFNKNNNYLERMCYKESDPNGDIYYRLRDSLSLFEKFVYTKDKSKEELDIFLDGYYDFDLPREWRVDVVKNWIYENDNSSSAT